MDKKNALDDIDIYGEQVREVLNRPPNWLTLMGSSILFVFIAMLGFLSYFVKYPDVLSGKVTITSDIPAINLVVKTNGRIQKLFVSDNSVVFAGQKLALLENTANSNDVYSLWALLNQIDPHFTNNAVPNFPNYLQLGDIQSLYSNFTKECESLKVYKNSDSKEQQLMAYNKQLNDFQQLLKQYAKQSENLQNELAILNLDVERNTTLFKEGVIAAKELEDKQREPLRLKRQLEDVSIAQSNTQISISNTERNIVELTSINKETGNQLKIRLFEAYQNLMNKLSEWEQTYVIKAPTEGSLSYFSFWSENQNVKQGDELFTLIPKHQTAIIGKVLLSTQRAGKLRTGQKAIIKLDNFPYAEFGVIEGTVKHISAIPKQNQYAVEIDFSNSLITNTGTAITAKNDIQGSVDIVTEDLRLIERVFYQIRKIFA
jgi:multidrug resistance efflux pump